MSKHTQGKWKSIALGGSSTVVVDAKPERNDTRIPAYGYRDELGHCIGYPFIDDVGSTRLDFVCFSHADAKLIAAAPELLRLLGVMFAAWENGPTCYEDPEEMTGALGNAVQLEDCDFHMIADLLNELDPRT